MNRTLKIVLWAVFVLLIVAGIIFFRHTHLNSYAKSIDVSFTTKQPLLLNEDEVERMVIEITDSIHFNKLNDIDLSEVEDKLTTDPYIKHADVFFSLQRHLIVKINEYNPLIKVIDANQNKYYISNDGYLLPHKEGLYLKVPLAYGEMVTQHIDSLTNNNITIDSLVENQFIKDIYILYSKIKSNDFLYSQINNIYFNKDQEYEIIPTIGKHIFYLGDISSLDSKLQKMEIYYDQIVNKYGWNKYKIVNLKYNHQIVCKKIS